MRSPRRAHRFGQIPFHQADIEEMSEDERKAGRGLSANDRRMSTWFYPDRLTRSINVLRYPSEEEICLFPGGGQGSLQNFFDGVRVHLGTRICLLHHSKGVAEPRRRSGDLFHVWREGWRPEWQDNVNSPQRGQTN